MASTTRRLAMTLAGLMAVQSALGLAYPNLYRDVGWIRATWYGNDLVTLVIGAPLLFLAASSPSRSHRDALLMVGALAYAAYNSAFYLLGAALNVFFPIYVASFVLAAATLTLAISRVDFEDLAAHASSPFHARIVGGYFVVVGLGLASVWLAIWAAYAFFDRPTPVAPDAFRLIAALDLSLMVPGLVAGGLLIWRRRPAGYLIAPVAGIQAALYLLVLAVNSIVFIRRGLSAAPGELPLWGTLFVFTASATATLLRRVRGRAFAEPPRQASGGDARR